MWPTLSHRGTTIPGLYVKFTQLIHAFSIFLSIQRPARSLTLPSLDFKTSAARPVAVTRLVKSNFLPKNPTPRVLYMRSVAQWSASCT